LTVPTAYVSLYNKYRPRCLEHIRGQPHIVKTLSNAIKSGRPSHAYLFTGHYGGGKTTISRILACMLNCEKGMSPTPCGVCPTCVRIMNGTAPDVVEMDAASNRGIDAIRALTQDAQLSPVESRCKVFIIDECHALTNDAANALLKTLEEPPEGLHFCLCTTEPRKVLDTIRSRCQHLEVRNIPFKDIAEHLAQICQLEGIQAEQDALNLIAGCARGSMRDALSSLEGVWNFCTPNPIISKDAVTYLGRPDFGTSFFLTDYMLMGDFASALAVIHQQTSAGVRADSILDELAGHWRDMMIVKATNGRVDLLGLHPEMATKISEQAKKLKSNTMAVKIFEALEEAQRGVAFSMKPLHLLEAAVIRGTIIVTSTP
jgi:DNA polymerase-3 subunit gamma/tau